MVLQTLSTTVKLALAYTIIYYVSHVFSETLPEIFPNFQTFSRCRCVLLLSSTIDKPKEVAKLGVFVVVVVLLLLLLLFPMVVLMCIVIQRCQWCWRFMRWIVTGEWRWPWLRMTTDVVHDAGYWIGLFTGLLLVAARLWLSTVTNLQMEQTLWWEKGSAPKSLKTF